MEGVFTDMTANDAICPPDKHDSIITSLGVHGFDPVRRQKLDVTVALIYGMLLGRQIDRRLME